MAPPGLDLSMAHCADLSGPADAAWAVHLKRRTPENKWEVTSTQTKEESKLRLSPTNGAIRTK
jgi:hypothetical protein